MKLFATLAIAAIALCSMPRIATAAPDDSYPVGLPKRTSVKSTAVVATTKYSDVVSSASSAALVTNTSSGGLTVSKSYRQGDGTTSGTMHFINGRLVSIQ